MVLEAVSEDGAKAAGVTELSIARAHEVCDGMCRSVSDLESLRDARAEDSVPVVQNLVRLAFFQPALEKNVRFKRADQVSDVRRVVAEACDLIMDHFKGDREKQLFAENTKAKVLSDLGAILVETGVFKPKPLSEKKPAVKGELYKFKIGEHQIFGICGGFCEGEPFFEFDGALIGLPQMKVGLAIEDDTDSLGVLMGFTASGKPVYESEL